MVWCKVLIKIDLLFVYFILISGIEAVLWYGHKNYSAMDQLRVRLRNLISVNYT